MRGLVALAAVPASARASLFTGETLDAVANGAAWFMLVVVPIIAIALFWIVHVMPEKIAQRKRHHPNKAIQMLCLLSLVFGGLLWPIAWLWAYTRPIGYKLAYGTEKHEDYSRVGDKARAARAGAEIEVRMSSREHARGAAPELEQLQTARPCLSRAASRRTPRLQAPGPSPPTTRTGAG